jgi:predicted MFS family arabinose efflux permease
MQAQPSALPAGRPWYKELERYHWLVLLVASLGWLLDCMDQQLFGLARRPAMLELLHVRANDASMAGRVAEAAGYSTMMFMIGWAIGGIIFGILGDRIGRVKTMMWSILFYSIFTGLSVLSVGVWDFSAYRLLTGLGVGGQFAVGVALVAETIPAHARPFALGALQSCSAAGNIVAALIGIGLGRLEQAGVIASSWRPMFIIGSLPALLVVVVMRRLKEPDSWVKAKAEGVVKLGSIHELFATQRWRRNTLVGFTLAFAGVVGLWGIGYFSFDLVSSVLDKYFRAQGLSESMIAGKKTMWTGITSLVQNSGAFLGVYAFTYFTSRTNRRVAFAISFVAAMLATAFLFWKLEKISDIFWMPPLMGFFQLALYAGYAIYLPELFPTRLRSTGTSFCYNVGRGIAAVGPVGLGLLTNRVYSGTAEPLRYAGITMTLVFLIGLAVLPWAPETKGQPLPE